VDINALVGSLAYAKRVAEVNLALIFYLTLSLGATYNATEGCDEEYKLFHKPILFLSKIVKIVQISNFMPLKL
jgi:hypothetical protein